MTRQEYLVVLLHEFPEFGSFWNAEDNDHREGEAWTEHGLWSCFAEFLYDGHVVLTGARFERLFAKIERVVARDPNDEDVMANAMCTCFLENLAKTPAGSELREYMGPKSRRYFDAWDGN